MTRTGLMRSLLPSRLRLLRDASAIRSGTLTQTGIPRCMSPGLCPQDCRCFAQVQDLDSLNRDVYFTSSPPRMGPGGDHQPPDARTLQLGKTVRELHDRLPTLLQSPLPSDILSPQITLHLFPSTHPHLPTVSGRIAYVAALWTAPVAWGRVPLVGNVKLTIVSERMVRNGGSAAPLEGREEKLVVKWKTCGKTRFRDGSGGVYRGVGIGTKDPVERIKTFISGLSSGSAGQSSEEDEEFCGIFIFEFDDQGKIVKHVIEHTEQGGHWDKMTRVVSVTDWLLGSLNGRRREHALPELALCEERPEAGAVRLMDRTRRLV